MIFVGLKDKLTVRGVLHDTLTLVLACVVIVGGVGKEVERYSLISGRVPCSA